MDLKEHFYHRARKYVESDYVKGHGENIISIAHAQTHALLASYEFKMMFFPRAWMSTGSAVRLCQMLVFLEEAHRLNVTDCNQGWASTDWMVLVLTSNSVCQHRETGQKQRNDVELSGWRSAKIVTLGKLVLKTKIHLFL